MKFVEELNQTRLYQVCVDNNWCDLMDNSEYDALLKICDSGLPIFEAIEKITSKVVGGNNTYLYFGSK